MTSTYFLAEFPKNVLYTLAFYKVSLSSKTKEVKLNPAKMYRLTTHFVYLEPDLKYLWVMNPASNFDVGNVQFWCWKWISVLTMNVLWHANLCSGLRVIHSPQFIKKEFAFPCILPRKRHQRDSNPPLSDRRSMLCRWATEPIDGM